MSDFSFAQQSDRRKKIILWDLGYTLVQPDTMKMFRYIIPTACGYNPLNLVRLAYLYFCGCLTSENLQNQMNIILHKARQHENPQQSVLDQNGIPLANIYCDHLGSIKTDQAIFDEIEAVIHEIEIEDRAKKYFNTLFFKNSLHKYLLEAMLRLLFAEPKYYGECFLPISSAIKLVNDCALANYEMAILSNFKLASL